VIVRRIAPFVVLVAVAACATTGTRAQSHSPTVTVEAVRIDRLTSVDAEFAVMLNVSNPNAEELSVDEARADLKVEDVDVGKARLAEPLRVPAHGQGVATLIARADWSATLRAAIAAAKRAEAQPAADPTVRYAVTGMAFLFGGFPVPFARSGEFAWPRSGTVR
jgi:LEA14-like dessication related protein